MKSTLFLVTLGFIGLVGAVGTACSSSSTPAVRDSGLKEDTGKPAKDASTKDTGEKTDGGTKTDAAPEAGCDTGTWEGLDAALAGMPISPACETCAGTHCTPQAQACMATCGCKAIEDNILTCTASTHDGEKCATEYIGGDSGVMDTPAKKAAYNVASCIGAWCQPDCS